MVTLIGLDDTDGAKRMCTTYVATGEEYDIIGHPRLVRLNPNVPWKTRGNAALCIPVGDGHGERTLIGRIGKNDIYSYDKGRKVDVNERLAELVGSVIEENAAFEDPKTNPGFVITEKKPSRGFYESTVRGIVELEDAKELAKKYGAYFRGYKNGRGIIGALAATAWSPGDMTHEIIVYRGREKWGTTRKVDKKDAKNLKRMFPSTFNNYDFKNDRAAIVPSSPCPILFGIRGDSREELLPAMKTIDSEKKERWLLFETNQATDDHLVTRSIPDINPYESVVVEGKVMSVPRTIPGGHVIFSLGHHGEGIDAAVYEPAKQFRNVARRLVPGDKVVLFGSVRDSPRTINIERIKVERLARVEKKVANPMCGDCRKRMKSVGKDKGYRCVRCGKKSSKPEMKTVKRKLEKGFYEPPVCARRHLSKPLKRMGGT
jgi:tRNA(Ile2)-agmatinylcytidine synthase